MAEYLKRVMKQVKLAPDGWDQLMKDFQEGVSKSIIQGKYGLKNLQYKTLRKYFTGK